jgi:hypothetical protein
MDKRQNKAQRHLSSTVTQPEVGIDPPRKDLITWRELRTDPLSHAKKTSLIYDGRPLQNIPGVLNSI